MTLDLLRKYFFSYGFSRIDIKNSSEFVTLYPKDKSVAKCLIVPLCERLIREIYLIIFSICVLHLQMECVVLVVALVKHYLYDMWHEYFL